MNAAQRGGFDLVITREFDAAPELVFEQWSNPEYVRCWFAPDGFAVTSCDFAPVMMVNWEFMDNQTPESAVQLVDDLQAGTEVASTRGARLCTWREAERVLAGFPDGRADEGPAAGPASLVGLRIAREKNWTAPADGAATQEGKE